MQETPTKTKYMVSMGATNTFHASLTMLSPTSLWDSVKSVYSVLLYDISGPIWDMSSGLWMFDCDGPFRGLEGHTGHTGHTVYCGENCNNL